ncbi:MAG: hypothetical protein AB7D42_00655 [Candidatus Methanomethylophilaceae archaeon]|nr:hypothetical protein [Candidatus Methanomethylophilaceae archaeon]
MNPTNAISMLGIFSAVAILISIVLLARLNSVRKNVAFTRPTGGIATYFLDDSDSEKKCAICFGKIGTNNLSTCNCGKIFHDSCASPTGTCPYCGGCYSDMTVGTPKRARCPVCGRFLNESICSCGAVFPRRDGTLLCECGNSVDCSRPLCGNCGALYEKVEKHPRRKNKHKKEADD